MKKGALTLLIAMVWSLLGISLHAQTLGDGQVMLLTRGYYAGVIGNVILSNDYQKLTGSEEGPDALSEVSKGNVFAGERETMILFIR